MFSALANPCQTSRLLSAESQDVVLMSETDVRATLIDAIQKDILGPRDGKDETLKENPTRTYLTGILFPQETSMDEETTNRTSQADDINEDTSDEWYTHNVGVKPASFGLTCTMSAGTAHVLARVDYGTYQREKDGMYRRIAHSQTFTIPLDKTFQKAEAFDDDPDIRLKYSVRPGPHGITMSVFVINSHYRQNRSSVQDHVFQPQITLTATDETGKIFRGNQSDTMLDADPGRVDDDSKLFGMLFRNKWVFAIGHGCAVEWHGIDAGIGAASVIQTTFVPTHTVSGIGPRTLKADGLSMKQLYEISDMSQYRDLLTPIADTYERWIHETLESRLGTLPQSFRKTAQKQIDECRAALRRIRRGIKIVSTDDTAKEAFAFANRAMLLQQSYGTWARKNVKEGNQRGTEPDRYGGEWRVFQLAFILLNIESITNPRSQDRKRADLLWFPTAGGKTEAYLGLVAFVMAHRRLRNEPVEHRRYGTVVLMRYTLRLLTLQQLQRITRLMCACEFIRRRDEDKWGDEPFLAGLWVGAKTTPNSLDGDFGAKKAIDDARAGNSRRDYNPIQFMSCVWCGAGIDAYNYYVEGGIRQCRIYCSNSNCEFSRRPGNGETNLPVLVVDEDIYKRCPTLVIGTVDKFAQMAWKWKTRAIFGRVNKYCQKHGFVTDELADECGNHYKYHSFHFADQGPDSLEPPELIIQDELHLISGPLGTLTGLYETAVDMLCTNDGIPPKIVASTATARRADEQIHALFNRQDSHIFPPQGFEFGESFFSVISPEHVPDKTYLGITSPMNSMQVLGRVSATILGRVRSLKDYIDSDILDQYYTLVSYFNRIKEMGVASQMYSERVPAYVRMIRSRYDDSDTSPRIEALDTAELTGRMDSSSIPKTLDDLEIRLGGEVKPVDVLLCTNMLSVGVDISRLGVMIINGQPKSHSEYIQASGRIGRKWPGLVITNYNYLRLRDLSHYESFNDYHGTLHKSVEPVSLTPFSSRARDKALFGVLVSLVRLSETRLAQNTAADRLDDAVDYVRRVLADIQNAVAERAGAVDPYEMEGTVKDLEQMIHNWERHAAKSNGMLQYAKRFGKSGQGDVPYLMESSESLSSESLSSEHEYVPNSLRDAEGMVRLRYVRDLHLLEDRY